MQKIWLEIGGKTITKCENGISEVATKAQKELTEVMDVLAKLRHERKAKIIQDQDLSRDIRTPKSARPSIVC